MVGTITIIKLLIKPLLSKFNPPLPPTEEIIEKYLMVFIIKEYTRRTVGSQTSSFYKVACLEKWNSQ